MSQLPWTEAQWARVQAAVTEEFTKSSVAGAALQCYGPLEGSAESVSVQALQYSNAALSSLRINDHDTIRFCKLTVLVELNGQQVADPNLGSVIFAFRRAANLLARMEDHIVFNGQSSPEWEARLAGQMKSPEGIVGIPPDLARVGVTGGYANRGLISYLFEANSLPATVLSRAVQGDNDNSFAPACIEVPADGESGVVMANDYEALSRKLAQLQQRIADEEPAVQTAKDELDNELIGAAASTMKLKALAAASRLVPIFVRAADLYEDFLALDQPAGTPQQELQDRDQAIDRAQKAKEIYQFVQGQAESALSRDNIGRLQAAARDVADNVMTALDQLKQAIAAGRAVCDAVIARRGNALKTHRMGIRYGETIVSRVTQALSVLEGRGYPGPYACVFSPHAYNEAHHPSKNSLVLPADRISPMLGGPLLRSGNMRDGYGVVVPLESEALDLVVATAPKAQFMQMTTEAKYLFRVYERFTLRIKDPRAVVPLMLV